jgi:hypothetical protein
MGVQLTVVSHDDVVVPALAVHVIVPLPTKPGSHVTATEPVVVRAPVPPAAESLFELATVTEAHVAAVQVGVFVHDEVE